MKADVILNRLVAPEADLDDLLDDKGDGFRTRVKELYFEPAERNEEIWLDALDAMDLGSDLMEADGDDLNLVPVADRNSDWVASVAAVLAVCHQQAFVEVLARAVLRNGADRVRIQEGMNADRSELRAAAKIGVSKAAIKAERERRRVARDATTESGKALQ
jgi:signal transduction histidine kinase